MFSVSLALSNDIRPVILVLAPMPLFPLNSGNRLRLFQTCEYLKSCGYDLDFGYVAIEDQIYRSHGATPPTDHAAMADYFRSTWFIELNTPIPQKTKSDYFLLDDWAPQEAIDFVEWYFRTVRETVAIVINYVFLSKSFEQTPSEVLKILDTHDRFGGRKSSYLAFRREANFFHTSESEEARGLSRADIILAIQPQEQTYFQKIVDKPVFLLLPNIKQKNAFVAPNQIRAIGFLGHGNDANIISMKQFVSEWSPFGQQTGIRLIIAGEICAQFHTEADRGIELMGYIEDLGSFYSKADIIVAPILLGTGLKMKVIEALAYGKPVLGTKEAFAGLEPLFSRRQSCASVTTMIDFITSAANDPPALQQLTDNSSILFQNFRDLANVCDEELRIVLHDKIKTNPISPTPAAGGLNKSSVKSIFGPVILSAQLGLGPNIAVGLPFASEFRASEMTSRAEPFSPFRWHWSIALLSDKSRERHDETSPLIGQTLTLHPILTQRDLSVEEDLLCRWAIRTLDAAQANWESDSLIVGQSPSEATLIFSGPASLLKNPETLIAFALPAAIAPAVRIKILYLSTRIVDLSTTAASERCRNLSFIPLAFQFEKATELSFDETASVVFIGSGIWGRVTLRRSDVSA